MRIFITHILVLVAAGLVIQSMSNVAGAQTHSAVPVDLEIPVAPTPVKADGKLHLVYELHITNFDAPSRDLTLTRLEILGDNLGAAHLSTLTGEQLLTQMSRPGAPKSVTDKRRIAGGARAVVFVWITLDSTAVPHTLRHRLAFAIEKVNGERTVEGAAVEVRRDAPVVIGAPLRGDGWMAANGPSNRLGNEHRRSINTVDGKARIAQRFAIDWIKFGANGKLWSGAGDKNTNWFGYGAEVLAVADGVVASVNDSVPENKPDTESRAVPITLETIGGNYIILDLGNSRYAMYLHLQPGKTRVKAGDKVRRGDILGLLGNSGNSDGPHLHFQICDANSPLGSEGLPFVFESFEKMGEGELNDNAASWASWKPIGKPEGRRMEVPLENVVVRFP
jgi:murein DD-endopeptidase MepM/ murein hydrolase activator NlpD